MPVKRAIAVQLLTTAVASYAGKGGLDQCCWPSNCPAVTQVCLAVDASYVALCIYCVYVPLLFLHRAAPLAVYAGVYLSACAHTCILGVRMAHDRLVLCSSLKEEHTDYSTGS